MAGGGRSTLHRPHNDWENNACLGWAAGNDVGYVEGYKLAGDELVRRVETTHRDQDFLVYPIVFLYRQYLELRLKHLRGMGFRLFDWKVPTPDHKLPGLWADCRRVIEAIWPDAPKDSADVVGECIAEFDAIDPYSFTFRYATTKTGASTLSGDQPNINLCHLRETMAKMERS